MNDGGSTRALGRAIEGEAVAYLADAGLKIIARNVELAGAELDVIAEDPRHGERQIVFIEVRSRAHAEQGRPEETVGPAKRRQIIRAATAWLVREDLWERVAVRFDVVGVVLGPPREISWFEDAFEAG